MNQFRIRLTWSLSRSSSHSARIVSKWRLLKWYRFCPGGKVCHRRLSPVPTPFLCWADNPQMQCWSTQQAKTPPLSTALGPWKPVPLREGRPMSFLRSSKASETPSRARRPNDRSPWLVLPSPFSTPPPRMRRSGYDYIDKTNIVPAPPMPRSPATSGFLEDPSSVFCFPELSETAKVSTSIVAFHLRGVVRRVRVALGTTTAVAEAGLAVFGRHEQHRVARPPTQAGILPWFGASCLGFPSSRTDKTLGRPHHVSVPDRPPSLKAHVNE